VGAASGTEEPNFWIQYRIAPTTDAVDIIIHGAGNLPRPDAGLRAAARIGVQVHFDIDTTIVDSPYAMHAVRGSGEVRRKYPRGDWMTSAQWFEEVSGSIVAHSFVDLIREDGSGLLIC